MLTHPADEQGGFLFQRRKGLDNTLRKADNQDMRMSTYQTTKKLNEYKRARTLYQQGLTTRDIAELLGKSRQWVWFCIKGKGIKEIEKLRLSDLTLRAKV